MNKGIRYFWGYLGLVVILILLAVFGFAYLNKQGIVAKTPQSLQGLAEIEITKKFNCFPSTVRDDKQQPVYCEASGVIRKPDNTLLIVHDKPFNSEENSPVFQLPALPSVAGVDSVGQAYTQEKIRSAIKYEDITLTPDNKYVIATTGFDRVKDDGSWDNYNTLLYWPVDQPEKVKVFSLDGNPDATSSVGLREKFQGQLANNPEYFKIEALTAIPGMLLFGVREKGKKYNDFDYTFDIIATKYQFDEEQNLRLSEFTHIPMEFGQNDATELAEMGLSGMEYDPETEMLYYLGSYEREKKADPEQKDLGGAVWYQSLQELGIKAGHPAQQPHVLQVSHNKPLLFNHKSEGITVLGNNKLLIVYDDDRVQEVDAVSRKPNQAFYSIVRLY